MYTWVEEGGVVKGMRKVLEERGLWRPGKKLKPDTLLTLYVIPHSNIATIHHSGTLRERTTPRS